MIPIIPLLSATILTLFFIGFSHQAHDDKRCIVRVFSGILQVIYFSDPSARLLSGKSSYDKALSDKALSGKPFSEIV